MKGRSAAFFGSGWGFRQASTALPCMGQVPFRGLTDESKVACIREALQCRDSKDCKLSSAGIKVRTGRRWEAAKPVEKALVGAVILGRAGLGCFPKTQVSQAPDKERQHLLQEEVRVGVEKEHVSRAVGLWQQGAWTMWESTVQRKVTIFQKVCDALQSLANFHARGKSKTPSCLPSLLQKRLRRTSPQQLPKGPG